MDPASAMLLFVLFQAAEKAVGYAGGKIADSMGKPILEALEEKARWLAGKDETAKRWEAFLQAFAETGKKLKAQGRHPELAKQIVEVLEQFDLKTLPDNQWLDELAIQLEKASLVSEKPDQFLLVELFSRVLSSQVSRVELSETVSDFITVFQDFLFAQPAYQEDMFKRAQWQALRQPRYDTRERYLAQVVEYNENLDFVGIPELKDRQALRIEDVFITLQTETVGDLEKSKFKLYKPDGKLQEMRGLSVKAGYRKSISQALSDNQKIMILGDPGSGKTTLLKYIVLAYAENKADKIGLVESRLPIFIRLYDYVAKREECGKDGLSFTDYLNKYCADHLQLHLPPDFFEEALERGDCCVCFDGLDELGAAGIRREITLAVSAMSNRYSRNRFIVTTRIVGYEEAPLDKNDFVHHTIQPLSDEDIKLFVEKWYKARERDIAIRHERTGHLIKTIMGEQRIKSLAANPLMLTIIALVHRIEAELPHERVKLYDKCVTTLVETWDKVRGMKTALRRRLLEKIAYWMHNQPGEKGRTREVREGTLRTQVIYFLKSDPKINLDEDQIQKEADNFIDLVKTRSGLLVERGEDVYTFSHLTFQEFLAACDIEKRCLTTDDIWNEIQSKLHDAHWREVVLLLLGLLNRYDYHNSILVRKIFESSDSYEPVLHRHLLLAAQALSDRIEVDAKLHGQIVSDLFFLLDTKDFWNSQLGFEALGGLQNDIRVFNRLLSLAGDEKLDASVRSAAVRALGKLGRSDEAVLSGLLALAGDEKLDASVRSAAARALGKLGRADEAARILLTLARDEKVVAFVRSAAARALGQLGSVDEAGRTLLALAVNEKVDAFARSTAVQALGQLGSADEAVLSSLLALAGDEKLDDSMRSDAAQALGKLGRADEAVSSGLLALAEDKKVAATVRSAAARALGQLGRAGEAVLSGLLALAGDEILTPRVRSAAARALGKLGSANEAVLSGLLALVGDEKVAAVRSAAAQALGELGRADEAVLSGLLALAGDENLTTRVRSAATRALGQLGRADEAVLSGLLVLAGNEKVGASVRSDAALALGKLGRADEAVLSGLLALVGDEKLDTRARSAAARALGQLGRADEVVLSGLLALAGDEKVDPGVRSDAAQTLGQLGSVDEAGRALLALVVDEKVDGIERYLSYAALKKLLG